MLRSVGAKTLHDQRRALIAWSLSLALVLVAVTTILVLAATAAAMFRRRDVAA